MFPTFSHNDVDVDHTYRDPPIKYPSPAFPVGWAVCNSPIELYVPKIVTAVPCGPVDPVAPVGPVAPVAPDTPCGPDGPVAPDGPEGPVGPVGPECVPRYASTSSARYSRSLGTSGVFE
jgi:hypothetical protein